MDTTVPKEDVKEKEKIQPEVNTSSEVVQEETPEQINWKKFREDRVRERKEKEEAQRIAQQKQEETESLKRVLEEVVNKPSRNDDQEEYEDDDNTRIQKEVERVLAAREKVREEERKQHEITQLPKKLASNLPDFNDICSQENLDYLEYNFKEIAEPYKYMPDSYDKWEMIYRAIKKHIPDAAKRKKYEELATKNMNSPQAPASIQTANKSSSNPHVLSDEAKKANWKRMQLALKGL